LAQAQSLLPPVQLYPPPRSSAEVIDVQNAIERQGADIPREETELPIRGAAIRPTLRYLR
jgi:hypothetical protein